MQLNHCWLCIVLLLGFFAPCLSLKNKGLNVVLKAPWESHKIHLEISEHLASASGDLFWKYLEVFTLAQGSDKALYENALNSASTLLGASSRLSLLKYSLAIHFFSPKLQMYKHLEQQHFHTLSGDTKRVGASSYWIYFRGNIFYDKESITGAKKPEHESENTFGVPMEFDHVMGDGEEVLIMYGTIGDKETKNTHAYLKTYATENKLKYIFRHHFSEKNSTSTPLYLQGFGVELALKSMEYKVIDDTKKSDAQSDQNNNANAADELPIEGFDFVKLSQNYPSLSSELMTFKAHLLSSQFDFDQMKVWQIKDLGLQSTQKILMSHEPLKALRDISQNLPILAHSLASQPVNKTLRKEIESTLSSVETVPDNTVWINRLALSGASLDPFDIYTILSEQISNYEHLARMKINPSDIFSVLTSSSATGEEGETPSVRIHLHSDVAYYFNDLSKDSRYYQWNTGVKSVLRALWPGQLHFIRSNLFTVIAVIDMGSRESFQAVQQLLHMVWQNIPARVGIIFDITDEASVLGVKTWHAIERSSSRAFTSYINELLQSTSGARFTTEDFQRVYNNLQWSADFDKDVLNNPESSEYAQKCKEYIHSKGLSGLGTQVFLNGKLISQSSNDIFNTVVQALYSAREEVQKLVRDEKITDDIKDPYFAILEYAEDIFPSFNKLIIPSDKTNTPWYASLHTEQASNVLDTLPYLVAPGTEDQSKTIVHLLAVQANTQQGKQLIINAVNRLKSQSNGNSNVMVGILDCQGNSQVIANINKKIEKDGQHDAILNELNNGAGDKVTSGLHPSHVSFCREVLKLGTTSNAVVTNGRRIILPEDMVDFSMSNFELLEKYEWNTRVASTYKALEQVSYDVPGELVTVKFIGNIVQRVSALLSLRSKDFSQQSLALPFTEPSFSIVQENPQIQIVAVLNPLSSGAQQLSPIFVSLSQLFSVDLKVYLKPPTGLSDMPLKNFFRYVVEPLSFDESGKLNPTGVASFSNLPQTRLLSAKLVTPDSWLVLSSVCVHDLDNIVLSSIDDNLNAEFTLEHILLEGSCSDLSNRGWPPRGLELVLGDAQRPHIKDSLVMSNLGYFQLKANPGVWNLTLASGQASNIYKIVSSSSTASAFSRTASAASGKLVIIDSWRGQRQLLKVEKRPGMEKVSLFEKKEDDTDKEKAKENKKESNIWSRAINSVFGKEGKQGTEDQPQEQQNEPDKNNDTIHIFSLASGHLYERFLKIMMLSAVKKTKSPVKFWLLSNFLSPAFKNVVGKLAKKFGFEVELVTYKWPSWLLAQTEKQRIIWGYKILFLDVLFPLSLKKVIYVDSDQVIKSDLKELWDMDLEGAPYGYTPFCEGDIKNPTTSGFRFWDSGFWKNHLQGRPYHISALYVVDLQELRQRGYADVLRSTYDQLGRDPNSLANLDQDLPNYLQHMVPIHSLPQEWLWCSTWCTDESKARAKTIDLCNNPLTKIPKLEAALQIIPEWPSLDEEIKQAEREALQNGTKEKKDEL